MPTGIREMVLKSNFCPLMKRVCSFWYVNRNEETAKCHHPKKDKPDIFCKRIKNAKISKT